MLTSFQAEQLWNELSTMFTGTDLPQGALEEVALYLEEHLFTRREIPDMDEVLLVAARWIVENT